MALQPSITTWNRLEPRPRKTEFHRTLRAEVRDGLWMLTRQWQFGEFKGEDSGTAIFARIDMKCAQMQKVSLGGNDAIDFSENLPLEAQVERDKVPLDFITRFEIGEHWIRLLKKRLGDLGYAPTAIDNFASEFYNHAELQFQEPTFNPLDSDYEDKAKVLAEREQWQLVRAMSHGNALDGGALYERLKSNPPDNTPSYYLATANSDIDTFAGSFVDWFEEIYYQPGTAQDSAWKHSQLEYQFAASIPNQQGASTSYDVVTAKEYYQGNLDWYNFDLERRTSEYSSTLTDPAPDTGKITTETFTMIPTDLSFPGMPNPRWWEMEDWQVDLGDINAGTTDLAKVLLSEFALIYSNDWMIIPYNVAVGSLCEITNITVKDVFGQRTKIEPAGTGMANDWQRWNMFSLKEHGPNVTQADNRLLIPPSVEFMQESTPVEDVLFLRDEMANMVWAIEQTVSDGLGVPKDGYETALHFRQFLENNAPTSTSSTISISNEAKIKWQLTNFSVPENWIPFIPARLGGAFDRDIQLRRAALPRILENYATVRIRPRTELLREGLDEDPIEPLFVFEEEVPRSGARVVRTWQRTRGQDGSVYTWLGRRKTNGRGQAESGMRFDPITEKK